MASFSADFIQFLRDEFLLNTGQIISVSEACTVLF
jgi:hypothetical protein